MQLNIMYRLLYCMSKKTFSPLQVTNKPCDGDSEHAFILCSMDYMVVNNRIIVQGL
jgi:hypothetical protein